jgi:hypothetical protein
VHTSKNMVLQGNAYEDGTVVSRNEIAWILVSLPVT